MTNSYYIDAVADFGAVGDGVFDNTAKLQNALDAAGPAGMRVYLPPGEYSYQGNLIVREDVTLEGVNGGAGLHYSNPNVTPLRGSVLLQRGGAGMPNGTPLITMHARSKLRSVSIYQPDQKLTGSPVAYPFAVSTVDSSGNYAVNDVTIEDVELVNVYQGLQLIGGGRPTVRRVTGCPLFLGILVDNCLDVPRLESVHFYHQWAQGLDGTLLDWILANGTAFLFYRADSAYLANCFAGGYKYGYRLASNPNGPPPGFDYSYPYVYAVNCGAECGTPLQIEAGDITGSEFTNMGLGVLDPNSASINILLGFTASAVFTNCALWGPGAHLAQAGGVLSLTNCTFSEGDPSKYVVQANGGSLLIANSQFRMPLHVNIAPAAGAVGLANNAYQGGLHLLDPSNKCVSVGGITI